MTSPELLHELRATRPEAPAALRMRVRELASREPARARDRFSFPLRRLALVAVPAAAALALVSAGAIGLSRSGPGVTLRQEAAVDDTRNQTPVPATNVPERLHSLAQGDAAPAGPRAQRVSATLTVEVRDSDAVSRAAQDALDLTRALGGYVVSSSVTTGGEANATLTVRVPAGKVQDAIVGLSALGRIVSQQVSVEDLQEELDALERRARSVTAQIVRITARLESETLDAETRALLEARRRALRSELRQLRQGIAGVEAEARTATISLAVVTPEYLGTAPVPSRLDRTLDEALNVLAWEGIVALAVGIVLAPLVLLLAAVWLGRRLYRRREEERLLAA
jgi:hypothetical protein